jgi:class 3 adenylate cyclase/pimeloyl-ACP methyl ester carboxylesterase
MGTPPFSHIQMEWQLPEIRLWYERFAARHQFVRFDGRGTGLSDRDLRVYSLDGLLLDLEAVVDRLGLEQFTLFGAINAGLPAIAFAARHPQRVPQLILWCAYARGSEFFDDPGTQALRVVVDKDWPMFTEAAAQSRFGWSEGDLAGRFAQLIRAAVEPHMQRTLMDTLREVDVTDLLPDVKARTLVLQRKDRGPDVARRIAARIPNAQLVLFEGGSGAPYLADADIVWNAIAEFLGDEVAPWPSSDAASAVGGLRTILFTDVAGSTSMMQRLGDEKGRAVLREHERITREALKAHGGTEVKTMGDGFMACFPSATGALECGIAMQRAFAEWNADVGAALAPPQGAVLPGKDAPTEAIRVRIGLNAGEPIAEEEDLFGTAVILAARIAAKAEGGEMLVANVVRELAAGKGFLFFDRGDVILRGFEDPVRLYEVRWREEA